MVNYKQSASALLLGATLAAAYAPTNNTHYEPPAPEYEPTEPEVYTYTTMIQSLCPSKGLVEVPYTIHQECGHGMDCSKPTGKPYGWEVHTKYCGTACGPHPTTVVVTECPTATPACEGPHCYKDTVECDNEGQPTTYTYWRPEPTHPPTMPEKPEHPYEPPTKPACEGPHCMPEEPVYPPKETPCPSSAPVVPPPVKETPCPSSAPVVPPPVKETPCPSSAPVVPPPVKETPCPSSAPVVPPPVETPCPSSAPGYPQPPTWTKVVPPVTPGCGEGEYCPPNNHTIPPPPTYTGAAVKTAASGLVGMAVIALVALL